MRNDITEAKKRLDLARKVDDLQPAHRDLLCDIINAEISDSLTGYYSDIPVQVYHHPLCTGYSSTTIKRLIEQSYNHRHLLNKNSKSLRFGSAFHAFCNEPHIFDAEYLVLPVDDRKSSEYRAAKKASGNRIILTNSEFRSIETMSRKLYEHPDAAPLLTGAVHEQTYWVKDKKTGLWKKCRTDAKKGRAISDLKSCENASMMSFTYDAKKYLYRVSGAYYLEVVSEVEGEAHTEFYLIACEKSEPYEVSVYRIPEFSIERAQSEIRQALDLIRNILDQGDKAWRGYQLGIKEIAI